MPSTSPDIQPWKTGQKPFPLKRRKDKSKWPVDRCFCSSLFYSLSTPHFHDERCRQEKLSTPFGFYPCRAGHWAQALLFAVSMETKLKKQSSVSLFEKQGLWLSGHYLSRGVQLWESTYGVFKINEIR